MKTAIFTVLTPIGRSLFPNETKAMAEINASKPVPKWLEINKETLVGKVIELPSREDIDLDVEEHYIVEFYSR